MYRKYVTNNTLVKMWLFILTHVVYYGFVWFMLSPKCTFYFNLSKLTVALSKLGEGGIQDSDVFTIFLSASSLIWLPCLIRATILLKVVFPLQWYPIQHTSLLQEENIVICTSLFNSIVLLRAVLNFWIEINVGYFCMLISYICHGFTIWKLPTHLQ